MSGIRLVQPETIPHSLRGKVPMNLGRRVRPPERGPGGVFSPLRRAPAVFLLAFFLGAAPADLHPGEPEPEPAADRGQPSGEQKGRYTLSPGDALEISVWKEEALTKAVIVLPDGRISFPLVGELIAAGKTPEQIKEEVKKKLSPYVNLPVISVEVKQVNSLLIYVIGKVNNPGRFVLNAKINVLQALATAGGLNPFAKRNRIKIFRSEGEETRIFSFRYDEVADGENMEQNIWLKKGDVVVVP